MTTRTDISQSYFDSPRIQTVRSPSTSYLVQDTVDTTRVLEEQFEATTHPKLIDAAGKEDLGGGLAVAITATLLNNVIEFEGQYTPAETGTVTTGAVTDPRGRIRLIDNSADFVSANVQPGSFIINWGDRSITDVRRVVDLNELECKALVNGTDNDFDIGDDYSVFNIVQCEVGGGNLVAVGEDGVTPISPILPSAFTQVLIARSSTGTGAAGISEAVWDVMWADHQLPGSFGEYIRKKLLSVVGFLGLK